AMVVWSDGRDGGLILRRRILLRPGKLVVGNRCHAIDGFPIEAPVCFPKASLEVVVEEILVR
ncbi:MAG: hypothetical protein AAF602_33650, partial [Myxococcota bacterium]